jgi:addiction module HigA family antidote
MRFHAIHPGVTLKEGLAARGLSAAAAALRLRVPPWRLREIVRGERAITPDTALRLSQFFGTSAEFWLTMQANYDLALTRRERGRSDRVAIKAALRCCKTRLR